MAMQQIFDEWPERYEQWFATPIGRLVLESESRLIMEMLEPLAGETVLDVGCGTGIFSTDFLKSGASVTGLDISAPMLHLAIKKAAGMPFSAVRADMRRLPFKEGTFDKVVSITALEFIKEAEEAIQEMFRIVQPGGCVVVATLNSLSPWAERRRSKTLKGRRHILENAFYRSPKELLSYRPEYGIARTAIHFGKDEGPAKAAEIEVQGIAQNLDTGAFVAVRWEKIK